MEQTITPPQGTYQPVGVPAVVVSHPGLTQGIIGIVCAVISIVFLPPVFGLAGIILGVLAIRNGEKTIGMTAVVLAAIFMIVGMVLVFYIVSNPELFDLEIGDMSGALIHAIR